jgi:hypothetical protein
MPGCMKTDFQKMSMPIIHEILFMTGIANPHMSANPEAHYRSTQEGMS